MSNYKLSIITINYNNLEGLRKTFESVFDQTYQDFEYIVIDGGSTDKSRELIEKHSDKIHYWVSEKDNGIYNALNKGIKEANGEYVLCLNSGDSLYEDSTLEKTIPLLKSDAAIVYGNSYFFNNIKKRPYVWCPPKVLSFRFFYDDSLNHQSVFIKKELHEKFGLYDEKLKIVADWEFFLRVLSDSKTTWNYMNIVVSKYDKSGLSEINIELRELERVKVLREKYLFFVNGMDDMFNDINFIRPFFLFFGSNMKKILKIILPYGFVRMKKLKMKKKNFEK